MNYIIETNNQKNDFHNENRKMNIYAIQMNNYTKRFK